MNALRNIDELGKQSPQILGNEELELFRRESGEGLGQLVKNRRVVSLFSGEGLDDAKGLRHNSLGCVPAKPVLERTPLINLREGIREIEWRGYEEKTFLCQPSPPRPHYPPQNPPHPP